MRQVIVNATLVDGRGGEPQRNATVVVEDNKIASIGGTAHRDDNVLDLEGRYLLPGLINAHAHLGGVALVDEDKVPAAVVAAWIFEHCRRSLDLGITTVRDTGGL